MNKNVNFADDAALLQLQYNTPQRLGPLQYWWICHLRAFLFACGEFIRHPVSNIITLLVIGIAFSLPVSLFALLQNAETAAAHWHNTPKLSLYLNQNASQAQIETLIASLKQDTLIATADYISPQQGLRSLQDTNAAQSVQLIGANPLPGVIEIGLTNNSTPQQVQVLNAQLQSNALIAMTQLNMNWVKRLYYLIQTLKTLTLAIAILFCVGLVLIVGNTIRLDMKSHQDEITILRLIGATKSFIQRPLLYRGLLYGVVGSLLAWIFSSCLLAGLQTPISKLALSYSTNFKLEGLTIEQGMLTLLIGGGLSYVGARLVAKFQLAR